MQIIVFLILWTVYLHISNSRNNLSPKRRNVLLQQQILVIKGKVNIDTRTHILFFYKQSSMAIQWLLWSGYKVILKMISYASCRKFFGFVVVRG